MNDTRGFCPIDRQVAITLDNLFINYTSQCSQSQCNSNKSTD